MGDSFTRIFQTEWSRDSLPEDVVRAICREIAVRAKSRIRQLGPAGEPPQYLGKEFAGFKSWNEPVPFPPADAEWFEKIALGDLVNHCFVTKIQSQLPYYDAAVTAGNAVDALLTQHVKFYIYDRQKNGDPVGTKVYEKMLAAISLGMNESCFIVTGLNRKNKPQKDSRIWFTQPDDGLSAAADVRLKDVLNAELESAGDTTTGEAGQSEPVDSWRKLLPQFDKEKHVAERRLLKLILALRKQQIETISCTLLIDVVKQQARGLLYPKELSIDQPDGATDGAVPGSRLETGSDPFLPSAFEDPGRLESCLRDSIRQLSCQQRVRDNLLKLLPLLLDRLSTERGLRREDIEKMIGCGPTQAGDYAKKLMEITETCLLRPAED